MQNLKLSIRQAQDAEYTEAQFKIQNFAKTLHFSLCTFHSRHRRAGFTIIELLIYTAIFAIVLAVTVNLFFLSKTLEAEVAQHQEVDRNTRVALLEITQTVRSATSVSSPALGATAADLYLNSNAIRYFVNANGILQKTAGGQTSNLTSSEVTIQNLSFTTRGEVSYQPTVSVSFTVQANTRVYGKPDYIRKNFQTTIQLR